ncbi:hypothetical protein GWO43_04605 [candidate division KSB1 bacterium]|nr:hypothetical protein [candidate division KSB1 bacterium]NIR71170.1 hypothetical protein [candidate division KSB1 bacterium]NIS23300.1 hypothetical protein [candidate division KSB1 bacterium]NIT70179.1 hypothetical protein [candidate division KSB1 bacterium]NIU23830.1 hypothetical protein [candidate division KSB1 bacterium]
MDKEKALLSPASVFDSPEAVLQEERLDKADKIEILRRWEYDVRELQVAEEENMGGTKTGQLLKEILDAQKQLGYEGTGEDSPPTKQ